VASEIQENDNPIERILLTGFPNPERVGCPPPETIDALGEQNLPKDDPAWSHIWKCSPCFKAFKVVRDARLARVERKEKRVRRLQLALTGISGLAVAALLFFFVTSNRPAPNTTAVIQLDLTNIGTYRGTEDLFQDKVLARMPRKLVELHIALPRLSAPGRYIVAILKSRVEHTAIALGSADAVAAGTNLGPAAVLRLDLSAAAPGRYYLATRQEAEGQEGAAYYYPILIE
jgi:hypothetical protein